MAVAAHELMHKHGKAVLGEKGWKQLHEVIGTWIGKPEGSLERQVYDEAVARVRASRPDGANADTYSSEELFPYAVQVAMELGVEPTAMRPITTVQGWLARVRESLQAVLGKLTGNPQAFDGQDLVDLAFAVAQREHPARTPGLSAAAENLPNRASGRGSLATLANNAGANFERIIARVPGLVVLRADALHPDSLGSTLDSVAATFSGGRYATMYLSEDLVLYRAWTPGQAREFGGFWSLDKPAGSLQTRIDSALLPQWGALRGTGFRSQATDFTTIKVPAGTRVHAGEVGSQGGQWVGGGSQILIEGGPQQAWKIDGGKLR